MSRGLVAELADGGRGRLGPRPAAEQGGALRAEVLAREFQGPGAEYTGACGGLELTVRGAPELALRAGSRARLEVLGRAVVLEDRPD